MSESKNLFGLRDGNIMMITELQESERQYCRRFICIYTDTKPIKLLQNQQYEKECSATDMS